jgi:hypothetical protein
MALEEHAKRQLKSLSRCDSKIDDDDDEAFGSFGAMEISFFSLFNKLD